MATYLYTLKYKLAISLGYKPHGNEKNLENEKVEVLKFIDKKLGFTAPMLKNVYFRNIHESAKAEDIFLFDLLKQEDAKISLSNYFGRNVCYKKVCRVPNVDIWQIPNATDNTIQSDGYAMFYQDKNYVIKVGESKDGMKLMRIYSKGGDTKLPAK